MLVQNKVPKQKDTPSRLFPALLALMGVNRTCPSGLQTPQATAELKQAIDENSHEASAARRGSRGLVSQAQPNPLTRHSRLRGNDVGKRGFPIPLMTRRGCKVKSGVVGIACLSSATRHGFYGLSGRVSRQNNCFSNL